MDEGLIEQAKAFASHLRIQLRSKHHKQEAFNELKYHLSRLEKSGPAEIIKYVGHKLVRDYNRAVNLRKIHIN